MDNGKLRKSMLNKTLYLLVHEPEHQVYTYGTEEQCRDYVKRSEGDRDEKNWYLHEPIINECASLWNKIRLA